MKMLRSAICVMGLTLSSLAQADFIGVTGDINYWYVAGDVTNHSSSSLSNDFNSGQLILDPYVSSTTKYKIDQDGAFQASLAFEHPIPLIPNIKLKYTKLDLDAQANSIFIDQSNVDLDQTDLILYYEILDNIVSADVGLGVLKLEGQVKQYDDILYKTHKIDGYNPLVYAQVGAKLPFTGFQAKAEALYSDYDDAKITDFQAEVQYNMIHNLLVDVGAKVGYRVLNIDFDRDDETLKMEFKGPYVGLEAHF
ncbi:MULTISPECIES: TIGR04219 family outer membrane beta-barrel protein [unclassified Acinetobacter]|uniref:TIGR04219 family outer membrane beta-barrel protein n=1 Tax=unclassified Acinetobacter TaxID=196816 RepID=UPI00190D0263|nr:MULTISPECIES: TIGR04219 family outer membrane beta-barrel protein [unclassified Acinetobacter]MBK0065049.1 TIGR04219 family outer membrane beta-barrel protein [Acinetobacter sp. S55]MBK0065291.1 TIGR04219 family outer membrane beta-barrel protein [Acinetobacter sp. S54]